MKAKHNNSDLNALWKTEGRVGLVTEPLFIGRKETYQVEALTSRNCAVSQLDTKAAREMRETWRDVFWEVIRECVR